MRRGSELTVLLRHERESAAPRILEALLEERTGGGPEAVRVAADRLLREHARWALDLAKPTAALVQAAGSERDRRLFLSWSLHPDGRTFEDLAKQEGICRQNVNGLVRRAESRVRAALETSPAPLPWAVSTLRTRLGAAATEDEVTRELARLGAGKTPEAELLTWLAGPYSPVPNHSGWVSTHPRQLVGRTADCLTADGGIRLLVDVEAELADLGLRADQIGPWLRASGAIVVHDVVVSMSGPLADVVERVLDAYGTARTAEEIAVDLASCGRAEEPAVLADALRARRFTGSPTGAVGLVGWPNQTGPDEKKCKAARNERAHGSSPKASVPGRTQASDDQAKHAHEEQLWLWVRVDPEVLRGSEAAVPVALVEGLGLAPLTRRTFSSRWGPVTLAYDTLQPTRGPVRAVALAAGAQVDDTLLLGFRATGDMDVEVRRGAGRVGATDEIATKAVNFPEILSGGAP